ncbi:MAG: hypothetical protein H8E55_55975 [Pelagibacterales bacterium]|nr:hypothetical protein [Pelagibacterales bacterium]
MIDEDRIEQFLRDKNLTNKDIKTKNLEYYPSGKVKMKLRYVGDYDTGQYVMMGHFDYDEDGNLIDFDSSEVRFEWLGEMMYKYHNEEEDLYDSPFPEKKPSKKTGKKYPDKQTKEIIELLNKYWKDDLPLRYVTRQKYFQYIADEFGKSLKGIETIESQYRPSWSLLPKEK